ncbi:HNH endonuclease [Pseudomonas sp. AN-B15]|uniref:HNH endonuclease n=1 Tax=Pseudomonas sp. AN-B15 TaxID=2697023 RepID=UPI001C2CA4BB|nr:HNH endonuclease [Pseudomonas sp. AN-B15]QXE08542.1 HNH endonuclease [Pseudomonas sp. AN-B15]
MTDASSGLRRTDFLDDLGDRVIREAKRESKMLTYDQAISALTYNPATGMLTWNSSPNTRIVPGRTAGSKGTNGYIRIKMGGKTYLAHRVAWLIHRGNWPDGQIDHVDGCRQNNAIANLRDSTPSQNQHNQALRKTNKSGVKGVSWNPDSRKWHVQVTLSRKVYNGGHYECLAEATTVAATLRDRLHGDFARHD